MTDHEWERIKRLGREAKVKSKDEASTGFGIAMIVLFFGVAIASMAGEAAIAIVAVICVIVMAVVLIATIANTESNFAERDKALYDKPKEPTAKPFDMTVLYKRYPALPGAERARKAEEAAHD